MDTRDTGHTGGADATSRADAPDEQATRDRNKAVIRRYIDEAVNKGNLAVIDEVLGLDFRNPFAPPPTVPTGAEATTAPERYKRSVAATRAAFPDVEVTFDTMIAEGELVAYQTTWRGTHRGVLRGIAPTGKRVEWRATAFRRVVDGRVVEGWGTYDWLSVLEQLGVPIPQ